MKRPSLASPAPPRLPSSVAAAALAALLTIAAPTGSLAAQAAAPAPFETGLASWYGVPFHGRLTASGERYDMEAMTAAHKTLPFGARVLVRCLDTGLSVEVRVNDRGPFVSGRIIDLSAAAGRALSMESRGLARVELSVLSWPGGAPSALGAAARPNGLRVQLASYASERRAMELASALGGGGLAAAVERSSAGHYRVVLPARDRAHAAELLSAAKARGFTDAFVKEGE